MEIATVHKKCAAEALVNVKNNKKKLDMKCNLL